MPKMPGKTAPKRQSFFKHGERQKLADATGISLSYLCDLLHGRRFFTLAMMKNISRASRFALGHRRAIPFKSLLKFDHPIFQEDHFAPILQPKRKSYGRDSNRQVDRRNSRVQRAEV